MIFVNYGGGGYYFFGHAVWNGELSSYSLTQFAQNLRVDLYLFHQVFTSQSLRVLNLFK